MASEQCENEGSLRASLEKDLNIKITDEGSLPASLEKDLNIKITDQGSLCAPLKEDLNIKITDEEREEIKEKNEKMKEVFERAKTKLSEGSPGFFYSMDTGFVLVINNVNFGGSDDNKRLGSEKDVTGIHKFFTEIKWRVDPHTNLEASEIEEVVTNISKCKDFPYRALFIFILTHGSEEGVHGVKHAHVEVQSLVNKFKKIHAEEKFWEIPKFFIIQACRGKLDDYAQRDGLDDETNYVDESMHAGCLNEDVTEPTRIILPQMSNFLVAYPCLDGYTSSRDPKEGSWFIQKFLEIAHQFYKTEDIVSIFSRVNFEVSNIMHQNKQMPIYEVGLRQRCFFTEYFTLVASGAAPARSMSRLSLENRCTMNKAFKKKPAPEFEAEAVKDGKKQKVKLSDYKGKYVVLFFYQLDFTPVCLKEIIAFSDRAEEFRKLNCEVIACSVDSHFSHLAWTEQPRNKGGLGKMDIPIVSDLNKQISRDYGVLLEDVGISLSGLFIIDDKGILQKITVNHLRVVQDVDETLCLLQAVQCVDKHGEVCPANSKPGKDTVPTAQN